MKLFDVYPINKITPVKAFGSTLWDDTGKQYLDLYGGHAVISIGHSHPHYVASLSKQLTQIGFYSNSVSIPQQDAFAQKLGEISGYTDYELFLCNSGAEANENAIKVASFHNGLKKILALNKAFHGRTAGAVAMTDNKNIVAPVNYADHVQFLPFNDLEALKNALNEEVCAIILEGIQGVGGINVVSNEYWQLARELCDKTGAILISDSVQCGYGRSGKFFSHDYAGIKPDLITMAKGMGNGFPIGGVMISPKFKSRHFMLGTTFGGNHMACTAALAVLEVIEKENLLQNVNNMHDFVMEELKKIPNGIKEIRGRGLMIGIELDQPVGPIKDKLLFEHSIFIGYSGTNTLRLLPSLAVTKQDLATFIAALKNCLA